MVSKTVLGVDILPMSSSSSKAKPKYAAVVFENEKILFKIDEISLRKLDKIITHYKPNILAIDNIWELAPSQEPLQNFLKEYPWMKLVQVTGSPTHGLQPVYKLAKHCGIHLRRHPSPIETAEICARLVQVGIGSEVALYENETQIRLARTRRIGPGGWSQNRYRRHSHAVILQATRDLQTQLDEQGIEYDLSVRKADYGLDQSLFTVYSSMNEVLSTIRPYSGATIRIKITPIKKKELEFIPLTSKEPESPPLKSLIVGIDPGTTTGIAILDLNGNILALKSAKEFSRREIIKYISKYGSAVTIASDVTPTPKFVERIASTFNSLIFYPRMSMKVSEKQDLVSTYQSKFDRKITDAHIRDSLACALKAYLSYKELFKRIEQRVLELNINVPLEKIKVLVMRGYSIYDAISLLTFKPDEKEGDIPIAPNNIEPTDNEQIKSLNDKVYSLIDKNLQLKRANADLEAKISKLQNLYEKRGIDLTELSAKLEQTRSQSFYRLRGERLIRAQEKEINQLRKALDTLKTKITELEQQVQAFKDRSLISEELERQRLANKISILKVIPNFSKECLQNVEIYPNDVIYMLDGSGGGASTAMYLVENEISAIITNTLSHIAYEQFKAAEIPVIPAEAVLPQLQIKGGICYIDRIFLERQFKFYKAKQKEMSLRDAEKWLENLVDSYRKRTKDE